MYVRRHYMSLLSGRCNAFAHCNLLKTTVVVEGCHVIQESSRSRLLMGVVSKNASDLYCARGCVVQAVLRSKM